MNLQKILSKLTKKEPARCTGILLAAGSSRRMEGEDKLQTLLEGVPVLVRSLLALNGCPQITEIVVVTRAGEEDRVRALCAEAGADKVTAVVPGGATRRDSALAGAEAADKRSGILLFHDGARPFASRELFTRTIADARKYAAAAACVPVKDTVKQMGDDGTVAATPDRSYLFLAQTPQAFDADLIRAALTDACKKNRELTDDASAVEAIGGKVHVTMGEYQNIKITTPEDLLLARGILAGEKEKSCASDTATTPTA